MDPSPVSCRSNGSQTESPATRASQTSGQASLFASNSNTTDPSISGTASTATTLPSNASAGISTPSGASTPTSVPTTASTGACIPLTASTVTTALSSASAGILASSGTSTPSVMSTNATTGTSKPNAVPVYLPEEELNRYLNMLAVQKLIPNCFWKILECGYLQKNTDPIYKYLTVTKGLSNTQLKDNYHISGKDVKTIKDNPSHMDAPLLRKVIRLTCAKLKEDEWGKKDERQTECLIDMLTECRNKVCHEIRTEATSSKMFEEIVRLLEALIRVGGKLYQRPKTEIKEEFDELQRKIDIVTTSEHERELIALQHLFHTKGYAETERYWEKYCNHENHLFSNLPTTHENVFYPLDVLLISSTAAHNRPMSYQELFHCPVVDDNRPVLILQGEAGSGKSSILMQIGLQFFKLVENRMPSLKEFHLLHFLQCNNQLFDDLKDFIRNYFPETCKIVSPEKVLECFPYLGNLILIDGYDEVNTHSVRVTKQFIEAYKNNPTCQIVFTARPNAVPGLGELLEKEGVQFNIYELVGISQEEKQLEFLRPFDCGSGLCLAFSALKPEVQSFFVRPINLVQFCSLFLDSPVKVLKWESINDVMRDIMSQYETLITSKLNKRGIRNLKYFIKDVLQILFNYAFEGLMKRMFTLDKRACAQLSDDCFKKIEEWDLRNEVDTNDILSVVYVTKVTPTKDAVPTYQYSHKSMQELMSALSLLTDLTLDQNMTLEDIIRSRISKVKDLEEELKYSDVSNGLLNVYKFILMIFSAPDKRPDLLRWLPELETALTKARADWQDVMMSCDRPAETEQDEVAKIAAKQKLAASRMWEARTARDVMAIARMLPHAQPDELDVKLPESEGTPAELSTILKMFRGYLSLDIHHSYNTYTNCEHILNELNSSCSVTSLTGCLASSSVFNRRLQQPGARLDLSLEFPSSHALIELQGTEHILDVRMKHHNPLAVRPLPRGFIPPLLIVEGTQDSGAEELRKAILYYAPKGSVYFSLWLENTSLDDAALQRLLEKLEEAGIRTCYHRGETCFIVDRKISDEDGFCLHCRKAHTDASQRCVWLQLADGGKGDEEEVRAWQSDLKASKALKEDGDQQNMNLLSSDEFAKFRCHQVITTIVPDVMKRVIDWGCPKPSDTTFLEYLLKTNYETVRNIRSMRERKMLDETGPDTVLDVSLSYRLINIVCENLDFDNIDPKEEESCSSVEDLLRSIKNANNDIVHRTLEVDAYLAHLSNFEDLCTKLIYATGKLYAVPMDSVDEEVTTARSKFYEILAWPRNKASHALRKDGDQGNLDLISSASLTRFSCFQVFSTIFLDVMRRVIDWGCRKPEDMTFHDYISERKGKKSLRTLANERQRQLKNNKLAMDFDVTLLYTLIPLVCENLDFDRMYPRGKSFRTVEGLLWSIKNARNEIVHNSQKIDARSANMRDFEDLCTKLIIAAGKLYAIDMDSVEEEVTTTRYKFYKVMDDSFMYSPASQSRVSAPTSRSSVH